jgi:molecular chaperone GrpE (heat shock protein)
MSPAPSLSNWAEQTKAALHGLLGARPSPADAETHADLDYAAPANTPAEPDHATPEPDYAAPARAGLEEPLVRLAREQSRLGALLETQQQQLQAIVQQLEQAGSAQRQAERAEARLELIQQWLPALDRLDLALATGKQLLDRLPTSPRPSTNTALVPSGANPAPRWARAFAWPVVLAGLALHRPAPMPPTDELRAWRDEFAAWLSALDLVRERWLAALDAAGVHPIDTVGQPLDPHRHAAVDTVPAGPDAAPGTIVAEVRAGYAASDRVLRQAEVIVARGADTPSEPAEPPLTLRYDLDEE